MDENPQQPAEPGERIEYHEVIERERGAERGGRGIPMWVWLMPLVIVVIALMWYVLTRAEPASPLNLLSLV
ncbi:MAG: hypothetical protein WD737_09110 [Gemmatimonadota bacterium]